MFGLFKKKKASPTNASSIQEIQEYFNNVAKNPKLYKDDFAVLAKFYDIDLSSPSGQQELQKQIQNIKASMIRNAEYSKRKENQRRQNMEKEARKTPEQRQRNADIDEYLVELKYIDPTFHRYTFDELEKIRAMFLDDVEASRKRWRRENPYADPIVDKLDFVEQFKGTKYFTPRYFGTVLSMIGGKKTRKNRKVSRKTRRNRKN